MFVNYPTYSQKNLHNSAPKQIFKILDSNFLQNFSQLPSKMSEGGFTLYPHDFSLLG